MTERKFCKDCKWSQKTGLFRTVKTYAFCLHPAATTTPPPDIVTGKQGAESSGYCATMRLSHGPCGTDGKLFEPKR